MDYFTSILLQTKSYFSTELKVKELESRQIQELFMDAVEGAKRLNEAIYEVEYALSLNGFNCLSDTRRDLQSKRYLLENFNNLEGLLR